MHMRFLPWLIGVVGLGLVSHPASAQTASGGAGTKEKAPEPPPAPARLWLTAPTASGTWTMRLDNTGERPMRIAADERLLELEIELTDVDARGRVTKKKVRCTVPTPLRPTAFPERRALLLAPGQSYVERLDPHLLCFGKDAAALTGGAVVRAWLGWSPPKAWSRAKPEAPFMAESTDDPVAFAPARGLQAPTMMLSYGAAKTLEEEEEAEKAAGAGDKAAASADKAAAASSKPAGTPDKAGAPTAKVPAAAAETKEAASSDKAASAPGATSDPEATPKGGPPVEVTPPIVDANAPWLEVTADPWSEASTPQKVALTVNAKNAGKRPMTVALLPRMLEFRVEGPDGTTICPASPATGGVPRDLFRTLKPGASTSFRVLVGEVCPNTTFRRQGLYRVTAVLHANETGGRAEVDAYTADVTAKNPTRVRLLSAPEPFHVVPPKAVPMPPPPPPPPPDDSTAP
ncbi:hypothetical protein [Chondromyces crocatus]|uniref:DUF11 domain-containing protein n=1 Tax=Chondromyces crocatus TaxID=52 RepID=A0A0K1EEH9_CHOCO|nr:hypothetical protein [Chondromyces crocatus]AKT39280.1 uncharacterized protein CMC5_034280 [Chondromyces crocatus]